MKKYITVALLISLRILAQNPNADTLLKNIVCSSLKTCTVPTSDAKVKTAAYNFLNSDSIITFGGLIEANEAFSISGIIRGKVNYYNFESILTKSTAFKNFLTRFKANSYSYTNIQYLYAQIINRGSCNAWIQYMQRDNQIRGITLDLYPTPPVAGNQTIRLHISSTYPLTTRLNIKSVTLLGATQTPVVLKSGAVLNSLTDVTLTRKSNTPTYLLVTCDSNNTGKLRTYKVYLPKEVAPIDANIQCFVGTTPMNSNQTINKDYLLFLSSNIISSGNNPDGTGFGINMIAKRIYVYGGFAFSGTPNAPPDNPNRGGCCDACNVHGPCVDVKWTPGGDCNDWNAACRACFNGPHDPDKKGKKGPTGYPGYGNSIFNIQVATEVHSFNIPTVNLPEGQGGKGGPGGYGQSCWQGNQLVIGGNDGAEGDRGGLGTAGKLEIFLNGIIYYPTKK